ncbi:MAG: archaeal proteasome endopeptidase complex subunit alpha [Candidatus Micrarchaeota archaeon]|nr:archaeal proteasome endopeptidase complex subunit alpha [Candidatus Micrarchaeota archaeon]
MYPVSPQAYDRAITVFSPDGRLFQVEYAKEAVKRGSTAVGLVCKDGVALVANRFVQNDLLVLDSVRKIHIIDDNIIATSSGLAADARRLIDMARIEAQKHRITYSEPISVLDLSRRIADTIQIYTQYGGIRPFGVSMLFTGVTDSTASLYEVEPSGAYTGYYAAGVGSNKESVEKFFAENYSHNISVDEGIVLALKALLQSAAGDETKHFNENSLDVAVIYKKDKKARYLVPADLKRYLAKVKQ